MRVRGIIFSGVHRGEPLINLYFYRLKHLLGMEPYKGTLDVRLDREVDFKSYSTKSLENVLLDGKRNVEVMLVPVNLIFRKSGEEINYPCWAMQQSNGIYGDNVVEIIAKDSMHEKYGLRENDHVEVEFLEAPAAPKSLLRRLGLRK